MNNSLPPLWTSGIIEKPEGVMKKSDGEEQLYYSPDQVSRLNLPNNQPTRKEMMEWQTKNNHIINPPSGIHNSNIPLKLKLSRLAVVPHIEHEPPESTFNASHIVGDILRKHKPEVRSSKVLDPFY